MTYSVVIPVYNSARLVGTTLERVARFFADSGLAYEIITVNDGSRDGSWAVLVEAAARNAHIRAINLLRNYGQHSAILCGLRYSSGDYVITLDDDLQNPPEEIRRLIDKAAEGHDLVFGRFRQKQHSLIRRLGSWVILQLNRRMFGCPPDVVVSNFRLAERRVVERALSYQTPYPYITGLFLMFAASPTNAEVEHRARPEGRSTYNIFSLLRLVARILFNYSAFPLRLLTSIGILVALASFGVGLFYLIQSLRSASEVPGWVGLFLALSFLNGLTVLLIGMLGEYLIRLLQQGSRQQAYYVKESVNAPEPGEAITERL